MKWQNIIIGSLVISLLGGIVLAGASCVVLGKTYDAEAPANKKEIMAGMDALPFLHEVNPGIMQKHPDWFRLEIPLPVQVRVFSEYPVTTDGTKFIVDGKKFITAIQVYGMDLQEDGSEKVVWKKFIDFDPGYKKGEKGCYSNVHMLYPDNAIVYLYFPRDKMTGKIYKFDRKNGELLRTFDDQSEEYKKLRNGELIWFDYQIINRPTGKNLPCSSIEFIEK